MTKFNPRYAINFKHIPVDVRVEKISKGLCYYYDQPYDRVHKCRFKEPQLLNVEISSSGNQLDSVSD